MSLFERRLDELEKKIDDTQTSMKEIKSGELKKQEKSSTKENYAGIVKIFERYFVTKS